MQCKSLLVSSFDIGRQIYEHIHINCPRYGKCVQGSPSFISVSQSASICAFNLVLQWQSIELRIGATLFFISIMVIITTLGGHSNHNRSQGAIKIIIVSVNFRQWKLSFMRISSTRVLLYLEINSLSTPAHTYYTTVPVLGHLMCYRCENKKRVYLLFVSLKRWVVLRLLLTRIIMWLLK